MIIFKDRVEAGKMLAEKCLHLKGTADVLVFGIPRGGLPVAFEIAKVLRCPLDVFLVRKLGLPYHEELAMGAIAQGGIKYLNEDVIGYSRVTESDIQAVVVKEQQELDRRYAKYRGNRKPFNLVGKTVILVDDGLATGATMKAAILAVKTQQPKKVIVATPVSAQDTCREIAEMVEEVICIEAPEWFSAVGEWYQSFPQTTDEEVIEILKQGDALGK